MATVASLIINLVGRTGPFERSMKRSRNPVQHLATEVQRANARIRSFARGLLLAAGAGGMLAMVKSTLNTVDATAKFSRRLGIATEELVGFHHAANLAGVNTKTLDTALQRMVRRVSEAARGTGTASGAIEELGLNAAELGKLAPEQQLRRFADALQNVETQGDRVRIAMKLFDSEGVAVLQMLEKGSAGLDEAAEDARRLGLTFDDLAASKIAAANDAMLRLRSSIMGMVRSITISAAPAITRMIDTATRWISALRDIDRDTLRTAGSFLKWSAATFAVIKVGKFLIATIRTIITAYKALAASQIVVLAFAGPKGWAVLAAGAIIASTAVAGAAEVFDRLAESVREASAEAGEHAEAARKVQSSIDGAVQSAKEYDKAIKAQGDAIDQVIGPLERQRRELEMSEAELLRWNLLLAGADQEVIDYAESLRQMNDELRRQQEIGDALTALQQQADTFGMTAREAEKYRLALLGASEDQLKLVDAIFDQIEAMERMNDLQRRADSVLRQIATPIERFRDEVQQLDELLNEGLLTWDEYKRAVDRARDALDQMRAAQAPGAPSLIERRFTQGFDPRRGQDPAKETNRTLQEIAREDKTRKKQLDDIRIAIDRGGFGGGLAVVNF